MSRKGWKIVSESIINILPTPASRSMFMIHLSMRPNWTRTEFHAVYANTAAEQGVFVLGDCRGVKLKRGETRRAREVGAGNREWGGGGGGEPGSFVHADIFMAISPPRLYSDCRAAAVYRHSLDTGGNRSDIYGLEGNAALLLFRREWKITSRNLFFAVH